jgi:pimeloyl-ACP methyl ester carboxylesterase
MATFILVHGGLHGAWCWERIVPLLDAAGHQALPAKLPGVDRAMPAADVTLDRYRNAVLALIGDRPQPPILVGHSLGGRTISAVAEARPELVRTLVFVAALLPSLSGGPQVPTVSDDNVIRAGFSPADDGASVVISRLAAMEGFFSGCDADDAERAFARLVPQPLGPMSDPLTVTCERFGREPKHYVITTRDRGMPPEMQRSMVAAVPGVRTHALASGHSPFYSHASELAAMLVGIAADG